jgi:hypothetical protein
MVIVFVVAAADIPLSREVTRKVLYIDEEMKVAGGG